MPILIPKNIDDDEILVHFIFDRNFKNKIANEHKLISKDIFLPNQGGVSLQRSLYCNEKTCKSFAKKVAINRAYIGFVIFRKSTFEKVKKNYVLNDRSEFEAKLFSTPLDENNLYLAPYIEVNVDSKGNPSHSDLIYKNPAVKGDESPNTAIRSFSRKLSKECKLIIDDNPDLEEYLDTPFEQII
ncbi:hypothetical protein [uncultured Maribacter sp.]|uniref:hypothetical protein n=1 Tax=uncultured Maribacter sp. TaxID=431308 RepID=UPI00262DFBC1|nr:hypothetical protein [uncultured Maribacter sp.]